MASTAGLGNDKIGSAVKTFATSKIDIATAHLQAVYGSDTKVEVHGDQKKYQIDFTGVAMGRCSLTIAKIASWSMTRNTNGYAHIAIPLKGLFTYCSGNHLHELTPAKQAGVGRPFERFNVKVADGKGLALTASIDALTDRAERLTGLPQTASILVSEMVECLDLGSAIGAALARTMKSAMLEMTELNSMGMGALTLGGYEELLLNLAVVALFPRVANQVGQSSADCSPATIRRARDYLKEHAGEVIELTKVASDLGVSMRAMQENFQRYYGFSPRDYLLECRLENARQRLLLAENASSVTEVAFETGFSELGHFSAKYRDKFGELPSETLRQSRRR